MPVILWKSGTTEINPFLVILRNSLASEQGAQSLPAGVGINDEILLINDLSEGIERGLSLRNVISGDPATAAQAIRLTINEKDIVQRVETLLGTIGDIGPDFVGVDYDILLDGVSIRGQIIQADIYYSEDGIHNTFEIQSIDRELFFKADPEVNPGTMRIEVSIGGRSMLFLLEDREGDEVNFRLWGRSISARDDSPYSETIDVILDDPILASVLADSMLTQNALDWQTEDFIVPKTFEFQGDPVEGVKKLADVVGAVVRSKDDGTILVRKRWPVRPIDMPVATPDVEYDRVANIIRIQYSNERGRGYDTVEVYGESPRTVTPQLDVEEESPVIGDDVHIRVYWRGYIPSVVTALVTDGLLTYLGRYTDTFEEDVVFTNFTGAVQKPIYVINSISWIGINGGAYAFEQFGTVIESAEKWCIGQVSYDSQYDRYRCYGHNVIKLLKAIEFEGRSNIAVRVTMSTEDEKNFASPITDDLLTSIAAATERGRAYLDDNRYNKKVVTVRVPYLPDAIDGNTASMNDANIEVLGNYKITDVILTFRGPQIVETVGVRQCRIF